MSEVLASAVKVSSYDCFDMPCADGVDDSVRWVFSGAVNGSDLYRFGFCVDEYGMVTFGCAFGGCYCW